MINPLGDKSKGARGSDWQEDRAGNRVAVWEA
jgi:hypothetical protein